MRTHYTLIADLSLVVLLIVWLPGYFASKRTSQVPNLALQIPTTALLIAGFICLSSPRILGMNLQVTPQTVLFGVIGVAVNVTGVAFAIWARLVLGRNWSGLVMTVKEQHELVQGGPYAIVRHPIYTGLLLAMLGTALTIGTLATYVGVAAGLVAFLIRVNVEERLMCEQFGAAHDAYRQRTRKLIPFVW
jgi:protein-S-isoprenylcysteine O-methyltransferase Ste14